MSLVPVGFNIAHVLFVCRQLAPETGTRKLVSVNGPLVLRMSGGDLHLVCCRPLTCCLQILACQQFSRVSKLVVVHPLCIHSSSFSPFPFSWAPPLETNHNLCSTVSQTCAAATAAPLPPPFLPPRRRRARRRRHFCRPARRRG